MVDVLCSATAFSRVSRRADAEKAVSGDIVRHGAPKPRICLQMLGSSVISFDHGEVNPQPPDPKLITTLRPPYHTFLSFLVNNERVSSLGPLAHPTPFFGLDMLVAPSQQFMCSGSANR